MEWLIVFTVIPVIIGYYLGSTRTCKGLGGALLGLFLGWIGVIIVLCFPAQKHTLTFDSPYYMARADWYPDPFNRAEHRYYDGQGWTNKISTAGIVSDDDYGKRV